MPRQSPFVLELTEQERDELESRAHKYASPHQDVTHAKIVLLAAQGLSNDVISARLARPVRSLASGANASAGLACRASRRDFGAGVPPAFPQHRRPS